jgi:surface protein
MNLRGTNKLAWLAVALCPAICWSADLFLKNDQAKVMWGVSSDAKLWRKAPNHLETEKLDCTDLNATTVTTETVDLGNGSILNATLLENLLERVKTNELLTSFFLLRGMFEIVMRTTAASEVITLPFQGTLANDITVYWEPAVSQTFANNHDADSNPIAHTFTSAAGKDWVIRIEGPIRNFRFDNGGANGIDKDKLIEVQAWGDFQLDNTGQYFFGASNLEKVAAKGCCKQGTGTSMRRMFKDCPKLGSQGGVEITEALDWDTSFVTDMYGMFRGATLFNQPLHFKTHLVFRMDYMFSQASAFNQPLANFNTALVSYMEYMFYQASVFNQPLANFNTALVTTLGHMFQLASAFNQPLTSFNTANVTTMYEMFFEASAFNQPLTSFNTASVTDMRNMFRQASAFNQDLFSFNTASVTKMQNMVTLVFPSNSQDDGSARLLLFVCFWSMCVLRLLRGTLP